MKTFGKSMLGNGVEFKTEVTNGRCPMCSETTVFVSVFSQIYRCMNCGADTKQKINGVIQFMPMGTAGIGKTPVMKLIDEDGPEKT